MVSKQNIKRTTASNSLSRFPSFRLSLLQNAFHAVLPSAKQTCANWSFISLLMTMLIRDEILG